MTVLEQSYGLLKYLSAVAREIGPQPVRDVNQHEFNLWPDEVIEHPAIRVGPSADDSAWLRVARVRAPEPAMIPAELQKFLKDLDSLKTPVTRPVLDDREANRFVAQSLVEEFGSQPPLDDDEGVWRETRETRKAELKNEITQTFDSWVEGSWNRWAEESLPAYRARNLYSRLYDLHLLAETESATHEVVWGHLVLSCVSDDERIIAPLFTVTATLRMAPDTGAISVEPESTVELETDSLEGLSLRGLDQLVSQQEEFRSNPPDFWSDDERLQIRTRLMAPLGVDAGLVNSAMPSRPTEEPRLNDGWVLLLRKRALRQERFYDELADKISDENFVPEALASVVSDEDSVDQALIAMDREVQRDDGTADRLLMPLPANHEQERIARQLARSRGVTVQGPPGTGKSHTIVNLVSHLVAQGKRVLVTAEKEQALAVLRDKIPEELRDLSLAVLGSTPAAMEELRGAVQSMQDSLSWLDVGQEERHIAELGERIDELRRSLAKIDADLVEALRSEQREYDAGHGVLRAPDLAQWFSEHRASAVITDAVPADAGDFPLTASEFADLLTTLRTVPSEDAVAAVRDLPDVSALPSAEDILDMFGRIGKLRTLVTKLEDGGVLVEGIDELSVEELQQLVFDIRQHVTFARSVAGEWEDRLAALVRQDDETARWVINQNVRVARSLSAAQEYGELLAAHSVTIPAGNPTVQLKLVEDWRSRLSVGKKLGFLAPKELREFASAVEFDGYPIVTVEQLELVKAKINLDRASRETHTLMTRACAPLYIPVPDLDETFRFRALKVVNRISNIATIWRQDFKKLVGSLEGMVMNRERLSDLNSLEELAGLISGAAARHEERELHAKLEALKADLRVNAANDEASVLWQDLLTSLETARVDRWAEALREANRLKEVRGRILHAQKLRERIVNAGAPHWAGKVMQSGAAHDIVGDPEAISLAWSLAKARTWLSELHGLAKVDELMERSHNESRELQSSIIQLASRSARVRLKQNMRDKQRRDLDTWLTAVRKVGKGTGKNAPRFQAAARDALPGAMGAVPIWIMPIYRVMENFDPRVSEMFDVIVVDESSQADLLTLGVLALGKKAVVVGDDKQTTPERVGIRVDNISALQDVHLKGLPSAEAKLLTLDESLYSISGRAFPSTIALKEHFRCVPEIIEFSNRYYNHSILPLREVGVPEIGEALRAVKVEGAISEKKGTGRVNLDEAKAIAAQVEDCIRNPAYDGLTFGVVTFMSGPQANIIQDLIRERIGDEEFEKRRLRVGNPPLFQGDERNVMFVSMVAHDNSFAATTLRYSQWANVAISRAQDQLWIFYSMDPTTLNHQDQRRLMIEYVEGHGRKEDNQDLFELTDSKFERDVLQQMLGRGYDVTPQHRVGRYRIDFVVRLGKGERLAIECDGDAFHGPDKWDEDVRRQRVLERLGWKFWRIRASAYYLDREGSMEPLWERLEELRARALQSERAAERQEAKEQEKRLNDLRNDLAPSVHSEDALDESRSVRGHESERDPAADSLELNEAESDDAVEESLFDHGGESPAPAPWGKAQPSQEAEVEQYSLPLWDEPSEPVSKASPPTPRETELPAEKAAEHRIESVQPDLGSAGVLERDSSDLIDANSEDDGPTDDELREAWKTGKLYVLDTAGDILDGRSGRSLFDDIGTETALTVRDQMREARRHGGRFKVDDVGRMVTIIKNEIAFVCEVTTDNWFPHHWE